MRGRHGPGSLPGAEAVASEAVLRRREGLERVRRPAVGVRVELFVQLLVSTDHLARVALDPATTTNNLEFLTYLRQSDFEVHLRSEMYGAWVMTKSSS